MRFNPDGTIFDPTGNNAASWRGAPYDDYRYGRVSVYDNSLCNSPTITGPGACTTGPTAIQQLKYNETEGYTSNPQTRYSFMASGTYDITDKLKFQSSARFAQSNTQDLPRRHERELRLGSLGARTTRRRTARSSRRARSSVARRSTTATPPRSPPFSRIRPPMRTRASSRTAPRGAQHPVPLQMALLLNSRVNNFPPLRG